MEGQIRLLTETDGEEYRRLRLQGLKEHPQAFTASYAYESAQSPAWFAHRTTTAILLGYFEQGRLLGITGLLPHRHENAEKAGHRAVVVNVYVDPSLRGKGVARALFATLFDYAKKAGVEILQLGVGTFNTSALALYESLGFVRYGVEKHALKIGGDYVDEILLMKEL